MKHLRKQSLRALLMLALVCSLQSLALASGTPGKRARAIQTNAAKVDGWLKAARYDYQKTGNGTWLINHPDLAGAPMPMLVAAGPDFIVVGVVVEEKKEHQLYEGCDVQTAQAESFD